MAAKRIYITDSEQKLIISSLQKLGIASTLEGMLLIRKLRGDVTRAEADIQQRARASLSIQNDLGFSVSSHDVHGNNISAINRIAEVPSDMEIETKVSILAADGIIPAIAAKKGFSEDDVDAISDEDWARMMKI